MDNRVPIRRTQVEGRRPAIDPSRYGELYYNEAEDVLGITMSDGSNHDFQFGGSLPLIRKRFQFTVTGSQTVFSGIDDNGNTLTYNTDANMTEVYDNGILLAAEDYVATDGVQITTTTALDADGIPSTLTVFSLTQGVLPEERSKYFYNLTAAGGRVISGPDSNGDTLSYTVGDDSLQVYFNGVLLTHDGPSPDYVETDASTVTLTFDPDDGHTLTLISLTLGDDT